MIVTSATLLLGFVVVIRLIERLLIRRHRGTAAPETPDPSALVDAVRMGAWLLVTAALLDPWRPVPIVWIIAVTMVEAGRIIIGWRHIRSGGVVERPALPYDALDSGAVIIVPLALGLPEVALCFGGVALGIWGWRRRSRR